MKTMGKQDLCVPFLKGTIYKIQNTSLIYPMLPKLSVYLTFALKISSPALLWY